MRWRWLLMALMLIGVLCCAHGPMPFRYVHSAPATIVPLKTIPIYVDTCFGEADRIAIDDAINQWNYALNGYVHLEVVSWKFDMEPSIISKVMHGSGWLILKIDSSSQFIHDDPLHRHFVLGFANDIGGNRVYIVRDRVQNNWMTGLMMHELGHLLGATHDDHDLMQPTFNWEEARCIDQQTLNMVAEAQHLPADRLNYCVYGFETTAGFTKK